MEASWTAPSSSLGALRHRLRAAVCCCFGSGSGGLGDQMGWRRRAGVGEFRYDPLSYALNFDEGDLVDADDGSEDDEEVGVHAGRGDGLLYQSFSSIAAVHAGGGDRGRVAV